VLLGGDGRAAGVTLDEPALIRNTFGEVGLLETPSARMAPDGQISFTYGQVGEQQHFGLNFQALPWLDASFRYSHVVGRFTGYDQYHYYDRSFGLKLRLMQEGELMPDVSVGLRDLLGTGVYASEYVALSKSVGPFDISAGMGWGELSQTSELPNPLGAFSSSLKSRKQPDTTGLVDFAQFFRGSWTGVFGGLAWKTPIDALELVAEYSSDKYADYKEGGAIKVRSPVNVGLAYRPVPALAVTAGWMYGSTYGLTINLSGDPTTTFSSGLRIGPKVPPPALRNDEERRQAIENLHSYSRGVVRVANNGPWVEISSPDARAQTIILQSLLSQGMGVRSVEVNGASVIVDAHANGNPAQQCAHYAKIVAATQHIFQTLALTDLQSPDSVSTVCSAPPTTRRPQSAGGSATGSSGKSLEKEVKAALAEQDIQFSGMRISGSELWLYIESYRYRNPTEAIGRATRILMAKAPISVEIFHVIPSVTGIPGQEVTISRSGLERNLEQFAAKEAAFDTISLTPAPLSRPSFDATHSDRYPVLSYALTPKLTQRVFDPDHPIQFMVYAEAPVVLQLRPGFFVETTLTGYLWSNYTYTRDAASDLPHVRSDILKYLDKGKYGFSNLDAVYRFRLTPEIIGEFRGGYLEDMFMGGGGQVLWRPQHSRFTFGADLYQVWQRDYNRLFGRNAYQTLTGHISAYYQSPWYGLNYAVHVGRYLAGDNGATFEIKRRFSSGVEIGAWATLTNVPFSRFGEGSFDKGIIIHIPFEWGVPLWSQGSYSLHLNSLTRDGGQRLAGDDSLCEITNAYSYGEMADHVEDIVNP
jgi:Bacterial putative lipoprotein (DUF940).